MTIPFVMDVVKGLTFDAILGIDFFVFTGANIDFHSKVVELFGGVISLPLVKADDTY